MALSVAGRKWFHFVPLELFTLCDFSGSYTLQVLNIFFGTDAVSITNSRASC